MPDETEAAILTNAQSPQEAQADGVRVKQHPLKDLIEADRYLSSKSSMSGARRGLRLSKIKPPGAV